MRKSYNVIHKAVAYLLRGLDSEGPSNYKSKP